MGLMLFMVKHLSGNTRRGTFGLLAGLSLKTRIVGTGQPWGASAFDDGVPPYVVCSRKQEKRISVAQHLQQLWNDEQGQDIAEYAVMLAVILVIVVGTIRLIGSNANNVFSQVGSSIQ